MTPEASIIQIAKAACEKLAGALEEKGIPAQISGKPLSIREYSPVGAYVRIGREILNEIGPFVLTGIWTTSGSKEPVDILLWILPGQLPELEIINYNDEWPDCLIIEDLRNVALRVSRN